jgi:hypothetical protein
MTIEEQRKAIIEDANRKEFETWAVTHNFSIKLADETSPYTYFAYETEQRWDVWQAARNQSNNVPVAWLCVREETTFSTLNEKTAERVFSEGYRVTPLYTSPQQSNALEMAAKDADARNFIFHGLTGCSNHGCIVHGPRKGMGTNGPCHCITDLSRQQLNMLGQRLDHFLRNLIKPESDGK